MIRYLLDYGGLLFDNHPQGSDVANVSFNKASHGKPKDLPSRQPLTMCARRQKYTISGGHYPHYAINPEISEDTPSMSQPAAV